MWSCFHWVVQQRSFLIDIDSVYTNNVDLIPVLSRTQASGRGNTPARWRGKAASSSFSGSGDGMVTVEEVEEGAVDGRPTDGDEVDEWEAEEEEPWEREEELMHQA